jgi:hypothetical protein
VGRQKKWSEELSEYQTQLVHRPSRTIARDERTTQEYHGLQMNSIEWSHKSMMEERTRGPQDEPYPGYIFKPLESRAMLIMREILRWDFGGVTDQIWRVTTDLIPRIVSSIRSSSKRVPPKDTEAKVEVTKVESPDKVKPPARVAATKVEPPSYQDMLKNRPVPPIGRQAWHRRGGTIDPPTEGGFKKDDLVLVNRAKGPNGPYIICSGWDKSQCVLRKLFRFGYIGQLQCFERKLLTIYKPNEFREIPLMMNFINERGRLRKADLRMVREGEPYMLHATLPK